MADVTSFNAAISACEKGQQWEHALADVMSFISAISACEKQWQWERAFADSERLSACEKP
eukprot:6299802-Karenia_brevis.AAC.1